MSSTSVSRDLDSPVTRFVKRLVRGWRRMDARFNRPTPEGRTGLWTLILPSGLVWYMPLLALLATTGMALGPAPRTEMPQLLLLLLGLGGLLLVHLGATRFHRSTRHHASQGWLCAGYLLVLLALAALLAALAGAETHFDPGLQLHVGAAIILAVGVGLALAGWLSTRLLRIAAPGALTATLGEVDLFAPRERYTEVNGVVLPIAALIALIRYPDRILMPAALLMLFLDEAARDVLGRGWQGELWLTAAVTGLAWTLMTLSLIQERLLEMLETVGRIFFNGPQRLLTWLVIALAALRLMQVHYVNYLFNDGNGVLILYILLAYVVAWFYGFWCDLLLAQQLLPLLADDGGLQRSYRYDVFLHPEKSATGADEAAARAGPAPSASSVLPHGRSITLHSAGRFKVEGLHSAAYASSQGIAPRALAFLTAQQLTTRLRAASEEGDNAETLTLVRDVQRATMIYPPLMAILAFVILGVPAYVGMVETIQPPALEIRPAPGGSFDLAAALEGQEHPASSCQPPEPDANRIALALSGGGTRAAMHGYAVLRGLASEGQICNLVAISGVSGGAAALGYFSAHQGELRTPELNPRAWDNFGRAMAEPFIDDVLAAQSSLRVAYGRFSWRSTACGEPPRPYSRVEGWYPLARSRSGNILAEDFVCTLGAATMDNVPFGTIFNASLLGWFDTGNSPCADLAGTLAARARSCAGDLDGSLAGHRLALTNLPMLGARDGDGGAGQMNWLVTLNQPGISLARAAAVASNFPPVFPDTVIDVTADGRNGRRYWVTDGGVIENRGYATLLLALDDAAAALHFKPLGDLHVIIADASALDGHYREGRGFGSITSAGSRLASALESRLAETLKEKMIKTGKKVHFHLLAMPPSLVSVIGTHWRLPGQVVIGDPQQHGQGMAGALRRILWSPDNGAATSIALRGAEIAGLVECLYSSDIRGITGLVPDRTAAALAIMAQLPDGWHNGAEWRNLRNGLGGDRARGLCGGLGPPSVGR